MNKLLKELCDSVSISGNEEDVKNIMVRELKKYGKVEETVWGDIYLLKKGKGKNRKKIAIASHMDSPGFIVKNINSNGTLTLLPLGGINSKNSTMQKVRLKSQKGYFEGVITTTKFEGNGDYNGFFGFENCDEAIKSGIQKGDSVAWSEIPFSMGKNYICAPNIDNRIGVYLTIKMVEKLKDENIDADIFYMATTCEETRLGRGAKLLANIVNPDIAIIFDVTYEEDDVVMGGGAVLTLSDDSIYFPMKFRDKLKELAQKNKIPLQFEVYNYAGTDSAGFAASGSNGCITLPLLIATKNNHTNLEIMNSKDIKYTIDLTTAIVQNFEMFYK